MLPEIWGKHAWITIHCVASDYPINPTNQDRNNYRNFYMSLPNVLPCAKCRNNLAIHLKKIPLTDYDLSTRSTLLKWTIDLHNIVNYYNGKPMLSLKEAYAEIEKFGNVDNDDNMIRIIILIIIIIIISYVFYHFFVKKKIDGN